MIKHFILFVAFAGTALFTYAGTQSINISFVENDTVCAGAYVTVTFSCSSFTPTGTLSLELSDDAGSFAAPVDIATVTAVQSGTITAAIPVNTIAGNGYRVRIRSSAPAFTGSPNANDIRINPRPQAFIAPNGVNGFCAGDCMLLTASGGTCYMWSDGIQVSQQILVCDPGFYSVTVCNEYGCTSISESVTINVFPLPQPVITANGPTEFCEGNILELTTTDAILVTWYVNGVSQSPPGHDTAITIISAGNGDCFMAEATDEYGCTGISNEICVTVFPQPVPEITPGVIQVCEGESVTVTTTMEYNTNVWTFPNSGIIHSSADTITITPHAGDCITVEVTDTNGCWGIGQVCPITVYPNPQPLITADGVSPFCEGDTLTLCAEGVYSWLSWSTGQISQCISATDSVCVLLYVEDMNGCTGISDTMCIDFLPAPQPVITPDGPTIFCEGECVTLSLDHVYPCAFWTGGISGLSSIQVCQSGVYSVNVCDINGCEGMSEDISVNVAPSPQPVISLNGTTLICSPAFTTYQWYYNGTALPEVYQQLPNATECGEYVIFVIDVNGCTGSDTIFCPTSINELTGTFFSVYPNPSQGIIMVDLLLNKNENAQIQLFDLAGQLIYSKQLSGSDFYSQKIDLTNNAQGMYLVNVKTEGATVTRKVVFR